MIVIYYFDRQLFRIKFDESLRLQNLNYFYLEKDTTAATIFRVRKRPGSPWRLKALSTILQMLKMQCTSTQLVL